MKILIIFSGCGDSITQALNAARPCLNCKGQEIVDQLIEGLKPLRRAIENGDIKKQNSLFEKVGTGGMSQLPDTTSNACLKQAFRDLSKMDVDAANQLKSICDPVTAGQTSCNALETKAKRLNKCNQKWNKIKGI